MDELQGRIDALVKGNRVVLFMKGTRAAPQCGFSAQVVEILDQYLPEYTTVNVLADAAMRDGVKEYAQWPTIPQLFVDGEFVGGCDIVRELDGNGELVKTLGELVTPPSPPAITISDAAAKVFAQAVRELAEGERLRLVVDGRFQHELTITGPGPGDLEVTANGVTLRVDVGSARRADGVRIDYVEQPSPGFKIDNPNAPPTVRHVSPAEAKALLDADGRARLLDVRTPGEHERARIPGGVLLTPELMRELLELPRDTPLVFHCHHGQRSHQAALHFLERGFTVVHNVAGGIDAWSVELDPSIPRY